MHGTQCIIKSLLLNDNNVGNYIKYTFPSPYSTNYMNSLFNFAYDNSTV